MGFETGEILGWVYVTVKILGIAALIVFGSLEAFRYRRRQMAKLDGTAPEQDDRDAPEDDSEEPKGG